MDLANYIRNQIYWSDNTFGPGPRTDGLINHITKELKEIQENPDDLHEWIDVIILAIDGAWRSGHAPFQIVQALADKQDINFSRKWPDWRTAEEGKAIEHIRE